MKIQHVPLEFAARTWDLVKDFLAESQQYAQGDYTLDQVQLYVCTGQWLLLVAVDDENKIHGAMTVEFVNKPTKRVAFVTGTGGKFIISEETFKQLEQVCRSNGATAIECAARDSVAKLLTRFGFKEKYRILGVSL
tara:strand:+ start:1522 stop:1929 length:408 start_codon:yes stop_codon:yes gene_type:complete